MHSKTMENREFGEKMKFENKNNTDFNQLLSNSCYTVYVLWFHFFKI